jgi:hypothetical protein
MGVATPVIGPAAAAVQGEHGRLGYLGLEETRAAGWQEEGVCRGAV